MSLRKALAVTMTAGMMLSFIPVTVMADSTGWQGNYSDGWRYYTSDSEYVKSDWKKINGVWYYFNDKGYMETGWLKDGGKWYYLRSDGSMVSNSWEVIDDTLYYFNQSGVMETNKWISCGTYDVYGQTKEFYEGSSSDLNKAEMDKYIGLKLWRYVGSNGAAYVGWRVVDGQWYHFNDYNRDFFSVEKLADIESQNSYAYGLMTYREYYDEDEDALYYFDVNGKYLTNGWYKDFWNDWYYFESDGKAAKGWKQIDGKWYLFAGNYDGDFCSMTTRPTEFYDEEAGADKDGYAMNWGFYLFKESGEMVTGWYKMGERWYYCGSDGKAYINRWLCSGGKWYYFDSAGRMIENAVNYEADGKGYDFDASGACSNPYSGRKITGWYERIYDSRYRYTDYESDQHDWNYFDKDGNKIVDKSLYEINGYFYSFDTKGICKNPYTPYDIAVPDVS